MNTKKNTEGRKLVNAKEMVKVYQSSIFVLFFKQ